MALRKSGIVSQLRFAATGRDPADEGELCLSNRDGMPNPGQEKGTDSAIQSEQFRAHLQMYIAPEGAIP